MSKQTRGLIVTLFGTALCVGCLAAWAITVPAVGSGWILFFAFLAVISLSDSIHNRMLSAISGLIITAAAAGVWYLEQRYVGSGWVLFLAICCGIWSFGAFFDYISKVTK